MKYWNGYDFHGIFSNIIYKVQTAEDCAKKCFEEPHCDAFTYHSSSRHCKLKPLPTGATRITFYPFMTAGQRCDSKPLLNHSISGIYHWDAGKRKLNKLRFKYRQFLFIKEFLSFK